MRPLTPFAALLTVLPIVVAQLNIEAKYQGKKYFGSATDNPELSDSEYVSILSNIENFGQITPANSMKWDATEPYQGVFNFTGGDVIANLAKRNSQLLRGHNLVWHSQLPSWVSSSNFTAAQLTSVIINHATTVVTHYKGQAYAWDVVNEPFNDNGTYRTDVFYNTLGTNYINIAFNAAYAADPAAKLYLNEYNLEYAGPKFQAALSLVEQLLAEGIPIQGVGFQGHQIVGQVPTTFQANMQAFADLGVDVAITELDIRMTLPETELQLIQQAKDYQYIVGACRAVSRCVGVTVWDYTDKYSWIPGVFPGQGAACPWDDRLMKKPAFYGALAGLLP